MKKITICFSLLFVLCFTYAQEKLFTINKTDANNGLLTIIGVKNNDGLLRELQILQKDGRNNTIVDISYTLTENGSEYQVNRVNKGIETKYATINYFDKMYEVTKKNGARAKYFFKNNSFQSENNELSISRSSEKIILKSKSQEYILYHHYDKKEVVIDKIDFNPSYEGSYQITRTSPYNYQVKTNDDTGQAVTNITLSEYNLNDRYYAINYIFLSFGMTNLDLLPYLGVCSY